MFKSIEKDFPFEEIDQIAEIESYRKEINRPIYHIHKWWAKRLGSVFRAIVLGSLSKGDWPDFYQKQDFKNKIILDPFMGSGTTLGEAAKLGANVIGCDVNPVSTFSVTQSLSRVNLIDLKREFNKIERDIRDQIQTYYRTVIPGCEKPVPALYYFWVKVVSTPSGEEIPLFSSYVFSKNAYPSKKPEAQILCSSCGGVFVDKYNATAVTCPHCTHEFDPQIGPVRRSKVVGKDGVEYQIKKLINNQGSAPKHKLYAIMALNQQGHRVYIKPSEYDYNLIEEAKEKLGILESELPLPTMAVRHGYNTNQARGYNYNYWREFFNERQLLCLGMLLKRILEIENPVIRDHLVCLFSGTLEFNNLFCSFKGEGTGAVRHMFSNHILKPERTPLENSIWGIEGKSSGTFSTLFRSRLMKAKKYLDEPFEIFLDMSNGKRTTQKVICSEPMDIKIVNSWDELKTKNRKTGIILNGDSSALPIPDASVDAVVTDPPYFDFVHYSELSDFFYAWLSPALGKDYTYLNKPDSSHSNEVQDREHDKFKTKICNVFRECYRVLKGEGLMCFSYHHSTIDGWMAIYRAISDAGFDIVAAHPVKAEMSVASPKSSARDPINLDAILVCKKEKFSPEVSDAKEEIIYRFSEYVKRFEKVNRHLSRGDLFVIACSQALVVASCMKLGDQESKNLLEWAVDRCLSDKKAVA